MPKAKKRTKKPVNKRDLLTSDTEIDVDEIYHQEVGEKILTDEELKIHHKLLKLVLPILLVLTIAAAVYILNTDNSVTDTGKNVEVVTEQVETINEKLYGNYTEEQIRDFVEEFMDFRTKEQVGAASQKSLGQYLVDEAGEPSTITLDDIRGANYEILYVNESRVAGVVASVIVSHSINKELEELKIVDSLKVNETIKKPVLSLNVDGERADYTVLSITPRQEFTNDGSANIVAFVVKEGSGTGQDLCSNGCDFVYTDSEVLNGAKWKLISTDIETVAFSVSVDYLVKDSNRFVADIRSGSSEGTEDYSIDSYISSKYLIDITSDSADLLYQQDGGFMSTTSVDYSYIEGDIDNLNAVVSSDFERTCELANANRVSYSTVYRNKTKTSELQLKVASCSTSETESLTNRNSENIITEIYDKTGKIIFTYEKRLVDDVGFEVDSALNLLVGSEELIFNLFGEAHVAKRVGGSFTVRSL